MLRWFDRDAPRSGQNYVAVGERASQPTSPGRFSAPTIVTATRLARWRAERRPATDDQLSLGLGGRPRRNLHEAAFGRDRARRTARLPARTAVASAMVGTDQRVVGYMALSGLEIGRWLDRRGPRLTRER